MRLAGLILLAAGVIALGLGAVQSPPELFKAWLIAWLIAIGPAIGALFIALLGVLAPGPWYERLEGHVRPFLFALPVASLGLVPVIAGLDTLYAWTDPHGHVAELVEARGMWLSPLAFTVRQIVYLAVFSGLALLLATGRLADRALAGGAAILAGLAATFFAFDISMSLDPAFYSTIFGLYVLAGQVAGGLGAILALTALSSDTRDPLRGRPVWLLFGACALWGYHGFMQYLVIWSGDLPHFAAWYLDRNQGGWLALFVATCALFAAPAAFLLQPVRHSRIGAALVSGAVVTAFALETLWRVAPSLDLSRAGWTALAGLGLVAGGLAALGRVRTRAREASHA